jgi:hypothetical protein
VAESYVEESIANKISISNKILGIGENQPGTSSTTRAENKWVHLLNCQALPNPHSLKYQTLYRRLLLKIAPTVKWMYI